MYVTAKEVETMCQLVCFVEGAAESADDEAYWLGLAAKSRALLEKMLSQQTTQRSGSMPKRLRAITAEPTHG